MFLVKLVTNMLIMITVFIQNFDLNKLVLVSLIVLYLYPVKCYYPLQNEYITSKNQYILFPKAGDIPLLNRKILKGTRVSINEHPYLVSIRRQISHYLTGTLLTQNLVISAAHPLDGVEITELGVVLGENYSDRGRAQMTVIFIIVHPDFNRQTLAADIALLRFYEDMPKVPGVSPTSVIGFGMFAEESKVNGFVVGWGRCEITGHEYCMPRSTLYYPDEYQDPMLKAIKVTIESPDQALESTGCKTYNLHEVEINKGMSCVDEAPNRGCMAVPGAPLMVSGRLFGFQSWGFGCGYPYDLPIIYTNLTFYHAWLSHVIRSISKIKPDDFVVLYEATKATQMIKWMSETRLNKVRIAFENKDLQPWPIDYHLAKIDANIYDVRDFVTFERYRKDKIKMYNYIKNEMLKLEFDYQVDTTTEDTTSTKELKMEDIADIYSIIFGMTPTTTEPVPRFEEVLPFDYD